MPVPSNEIGAHDPLIYGITSPVEAVHSDPFLLYLRRTLTSTVLLNIDRDLARSSSWLLPHISFLSIYLTDHYSDTTAVPRTSGISSHEQLEELVNVCQSLATDITIFQSLQISKEWHSEIISDLQTGQFAHSSMVISNVIKSLFASSVDPDAVYPTRILRSMLTGIFRYADVTVEEAEKWFRLSQSLETSRKPFSKRCRL